MRRRVVASTLAHGRLYPKAASHGREVAGWWARTARRTCGALTEVSDDTDLHEPPWMGVKFIKPSEFQASLRPEVSAIAANTDTPEGIASDEQDAAPSGDKLQGAFSSIFAKSASIAPKAALEFAPPAEVVSAALEVALCPEHRSSWDMVSQRLMELELDSVESLLVLDCLVRLEIRDEALLSKVVDRIEARYFSMELGLPDHPPEHGVGLALTAFPHRRENGSADFQMLVGNLPVKHKIKIILRDGFRREKGLLRLKRPRPEEDPDKRWKRLQPVEMELWEREQFEKGRIKVKLIKNVQAQVTKMRPGNKLSATLGLQLLQMLPETTAGDLAEIAQACAFPHTRFLHGDLLADFEDELAQRICALDTHLVVPHLLSFASAFRFFEGSEAWRTWRRKLVPACVQLIRSPRVLERLDEQQGYHHWIGGVRPCVSHAAADGKDESNLLRMRADRASRLFVCLSTARQLTLDTELFDGLTRPLEAILLRWRDLATKDHTSGTSRTGSPAGPLLLPLELIADVLAACSSCGVAAAGAPVNNESLPHLLVDLFVKQFGDDIKQGHLRRSKYASADLANIAHSAALLIPSIKGEVGVAEALELLWEAALPSLKQAKPQFVLMMLNAVVRAGSEELLTSQSVLDAVDAHLSQKLDYDPATLGQLGP